jgi:hypothetical protein
VPQLGRYYAAVNEWESFALQTQMAIDLYTYISSSKAFEPGDGSPEQRLYDTANAVKHLRGRVASQQFREEDILPLWINRDGIRSFEFNLTFDEATSVLRDVASFADMLQNPAGMRAEAERRLNPEPPAT